MSARRAWNRAAYACGALLGLASGAEAQGVSDVVELSSASVVQIIGEYGNGTGFVLDADAGMVITNAHVTLGNAEVGVALSESYKVRGAVVYEDQVADVAVIGVNPAAVAGRPSLALDPDAYQASRVGDPIVAMGFPLGAGVVASTGIIARKGTRTFITDANVNAGNSGGPIFRLDGSLIGMTTFLQSSGAGAGLGGALTASAVLAAIRGVDLTPEVALSADSLPTMPLDAFPRSVLDNAEAASRWPTESYDISDESLVSGFEVVFVTPPLMVRQGLDLADLTIWREETGGPTPVVVLRVRPQVGQSTWATLANLVLGAAAVADNGAYFPIYSPSAKGRLLDVQVQDLRDGRVEPIDRKRVAAMVSGQTVQVMHVVLPASLFAEDPERGWGERLVVQIQDAERGFLPWVVPARTMEQIHSDFREYLRGGGPN